MKKIPLGVRLISYLYYFYSILAIIVGIVIFVLGIKFFQRLPVFGPKDYVPDNIEDYVFGLIWISSIIFGIFSFFLGKAIYRGKKFARDWLLVLNSLLLIVSLFAWIFIISYAWIISLFSLLALLYLLFSKESKDFFQNEK